MRRLAGLLVVLVVVVAAGACGDEGEPRSEPPSSEDVEREAALGSGSWGGARTTDEGLLISFIGGKRYEEGNHCTVEYSARTEESGDEVRVEILARSPRAAPATTVYPLACTAEGYFRTLVIPLSRPLGERRLVEVQFDRVQPVFDGATLLEPAALPPGWSLLFEGPGYPDPEKATSWTRTWGPPPTPPEDGHCTPSPAPLTLTQGLPAIVDESPPNGEKTVSTHDVGGAEATYAEGGTANSRRLTWLASDQGFVLSSSDRCLGDPPTTVDVLVDLARSLR